MNEKAVSADAKFNRRELTEILFRVIGAAILLGGSIAIPNLPIALGVIIKAVNAFKKQPVSDKKIIRSLKRMEKNRIIDFFEEGENVFVLINYNNREKILKYSIKALLDFKKSSHKWDGRWYLVFFDVPELERIKRDRLRLYLKELGFYPYQKSVYVFPYECKKEIELIKEIVDGSKYLKYIVATEIQDETLLTSYFKI